MTSFLGNREAALSYLDGRLFHLVPADRQSALSAALDRNWPDGARKYRVRPCPRLIEAMVAVPDWFIDTNTGHGVAASPHLRTATAGALLEHVAALFEQGTLQPVNDYAAGQGGLQRVEDGWHLLNALAGNPRIGPRCATRLFNFDIAGGNRMDPYRTRSWLRNKHVDSDDLTGSTVFGLSENSAIDARLYARLVDFVVDDSGREPNFCEHSSMMRTLAGANLLRHPLVSAPAAERVGRMMADAVREDPANARLLGPLLAPDMAPAYGLSEDLLSVLVVAAAVA